MKILFDLLLCQPMDGSKFHGGGEYIKRVFRELILTKTPDVEVVVYYNFDAFLDYWLLDILNNYEIKSYDIKTIPDIKNIFDKDVFDVFYTGQPYEYKREYFPSEIYKIGTFHGMRAVECPHDYYEFKYIDKKSDRIKEHIRNLLKYTKIGYEKNINTAIGNYADCIECFDKLVCDSIHTKYSLKSYYPWVTDDSIEVFYPPLKYSEEKKVLDLEGDEYILMIGGNRWLKNVYRGVKAIDQLYQRGHLKNITTVVVGNLSPMIIGELKNTDKFDFKGYVSDAELNTLYKNCSVFLYPTLNEGFGYPPLEAMQYGKTCIVSSVCSLPEICGNAVYYVNPYDIGEIQNRILWALERPINVTKIKKQFDEVSKIQKLDLSKICNLICKKCVSGE